MTTRISYSEINEFLRCNYAWYLRYVMRLQKNQPERALDLGSAVHAGLAEYFKGGIPFRGIDTWGMTQQDDEEGTIEDTVNKAYQLVPRAIKYMEEHGFYRSGVDYVEEPFLVDTASEQQYIGVIDLVIKDSDGRTWLWDHKVRGAIQPDDKEEFNLQALAYGYLLYKQGIDVTGTVTFQIANDLPNIPSVNKDGTVSRRPCKTDWPTYRQTVIDAGQNPVDYVDMQVKLADTQFFRISRTYRSTYEMQSVWQTIIERASLQIKNSRADSGFPVRTGYGGIFCTRCWCKDYCLADLRGHDTKNLIGTEYIVRTERVS